MKGKVSVYTEMPNVARFRSRVQNPSKELTGQLREILQRVVAEVINSNTIAIRAKFIEAIQDLGLEFKSEAHAAAVSSVLSSFFDVVAAATPEELAAIAGQDDLSEDVEIEETEKPATPNDDEFTD